MLKVFCSVVWIVVALLCYNASAAPLVYEGTDGLGKGKHIVFIASDHEYKSEETLPAMARILAKHHGFKCTVLFGVNEKGEIAPGRSNVPGMEALATADLAVVFTRFQNWPDEQMEHFVAYLERGGPIVGLRTATHGFKIPKDSKWAKYSNGYEGDDYKDGWGRQVLGEKWAGHYGGNHKKSTRLDIVPEKKNHPILLGVKDMWAQCGGYKANPLQPSEVLAMAQPLLGMTADAPADKDMPAVPGAWTRTYRGASGVEGRVFTSTYGASSDIENAGYRRMLINGCIWAVGLDDQIKADANISFVGPYNATWARGKGRRKAGTKPEDMAGWDSPIVPLEASAKAARASGKPNFVIIFTDDQGYGDLSCFGSTKIKTPNIDRIAKEGRKFTSFMVASPVCTPSRAALLTGCYPKRVGMHQHVLFPQSTKGLNPSEHTIADHLQAQGYATACIGKWHLGHHPETLPRQNGFDSYYGIPYSNDMNYPDNKGKPRGVSSDALWMNQESTLTHWNTPLLEDEAIVELPVDQRTVTRRYTDRAVEFIKENKEKPFFLYLPHSMPHIPLYVPEDVYDSNPENAYTCVIEHIDAEVGRVMDTIREQGLSENTYVIYTTDNGPWLQFKNHGGSAGPLRAGKGTTFEGGQRVPCIMWGPGRIPAGTECDELVGTIDLLPTIAAITKSPLPKDRKIDGMNVRGLLTGKKKKSPRTEFVHYTSQGRLEGIRKGKWKLLVKVQNRRRNQNQNQSTPAAAPEVLLFDLAADLGEQNNLAETHPEIVKELKARMEELDAEIAANARAPWRLKE